MPRTKRDILERFYAKVDRSGGPDACHRWLGCFNRPSVHFKRKHRGGDSRRPTFRVSVTPSVMVYAHRFALSLYDGVPLDERVGLEACHKPSCGNAWCVNGAHLYWGTPDQNRDDRYGGRDAVQPAFLEDTL